MDGGGALNVIFLDFDGVVNIPMWKQAKNEWVCSYNFPQNGKVNNEQAVQWVSEFCEKYRYSIVISSTWRFDGFDLCVKCLKNAGLRNGIEIIGCTPWLDGKQRGDEITVWLKEHPDVKNYLIFDDDSNMTCHMDRLVKCDPVVGFTMREFNVAEMLHSAFNTM
jgi:hypothetical protein